MKTFFVVLIPLFLLSCHKHAVKNKEQITEKYMLIKDNLYKDAQNNLYFKTLDRSQNSLGETRYLNVVYSETFGVNGIKEMKEVIDPATFKYMGNDYYRDKSNIYFFYIMEDGGTFSLVKDVDKNSFKIVNEEEKEHHDSYDDKHRFKKGEIVK
jgi:hypothetical protein